jgi:hypothetical protein
LEEAFDIGEFFLRFLNREPKTVIIPGREPRLRA